MLLSPDGKHLAIESTQGSVAIVDPTDAEPIVVTYGIDFPSPSQAFTWTADSRYLLVVQDHRIAVLRGEATELSSRGSRTDGVEELVALP